MGAWLSFIIHHGRIYSHSVDHRYSDGVSTYHWAIIFYRFKVFEAEGTQQANIFAVLGLTTTKTCIYAGVNKMNTVKILAIVLIVAGASGLVYGGFTYTKETHQAKIGPIELSVNDTETVNVPVWAGVAAMVAGAFLLFARK